MGFLFWPLLVFAIFVGVSVVIITISACILIGEDRLTLPGSNARKVETARADALVAELRFKQEQAVINTDELINTRLERALERRGLPRGNDS